MFPPPPGAQVRPQPMLHQHLSLLPGLLLLILPAARHRSSVEAQEAARFEDVPRHQAGGGTLFGMFKSFKVDKSHVVWCSSVVI